MPEIYIVFSSTPYKIGKAIRAITKEPYNHVSISLNETLTELYGFARRHYRLPLYGGFVKESIARYHPNGQASEIKVCRIPVSAEDFASIRNRLEGMYAERERYLYNHLSILSAPLRRWIKGRDSYICVEFVVEILSRIGVVSGDYCTVCELMDKLAPYESYTGPMPDPVEADPEFFAARPVRHPTLTTLRDLFALFGRL